jgi:hypothetical protein
VVIALAAAFGLVSIAVTVRQDMARNRHDRARTDVGAAARAEVTVNRPALGPEKVQTVDPSGRTAMAVTRPAIRCRAVLSLAGCRLG